MGKVRLRTVTLREDKVEPNDLIDMGSYIWKVLVILYLELGKVDFKCRRFHVNCESSLETAYFSLSVNTWLRLKREFQSDEQ